jgi:hypothetical protein
MTRDSELKSKGRAHIYRFTDGKYLAVKEQHIEWHSRQSDACPIFTMENIGPQRADNFHINLLREVHKTCNDRWCFQRAGFVGDYERSLYDPLPKNP